ncbi:MAG TPA: ABC transporter ATP-binding protein [Verrucomicrobiae bacterium]|nr:ABC transporter ATP-binding protein [Verrucomicrobiae bacterium]
MDALPVSKVAAERSGPGLVKLQLRGVTKNFESKAQPVQALQAIDLQINEGECVVLFGPSGCGKSTLLNLIAGFETLTAGEIRLDGQPVRNEPGSDRLMLFQEHALFPWLNVLDNVMYGLRWQRPYRFRLRARRRKAMDLLRMVHLEEFARSAVHELSGGMKQRVALARALAPDPQLLLIDEPFPALDALVRAKLYIELQEILVRTRKTILAVTHDPREAACLGDRVIVFTGRPGRIKAELKVDLPRPRDINQREVAEHASRINSQLESEHETEPGATT